MEVVVVGTAPRAIRSGAFGKRALHTFSGHSKGGPSRCPPLAEVARSDGGGCCRDCSPSNPKRRVWQTRPTYPLWPLQRVPSRCPPPAEVARRDGGGCCRDCSPSSPKRRVWQTRPTYPLWPLQRGTSGASTGSATNFDKVSNTKIVFAFFCLIY